MGTVKRKRPATGGKAKGQATEETLAEELPADALLTDSDAIDQISGLLDSRPWDREAVEQIAALIRETGRDVAYQEADREVEIPEGETYDDADEGWLYRDEDLDDEPAQLVASAYARISRIAGADDPLRCPSCAGDAEWAEVGSRIHCNFCGYEGPPAKASAKASAPKELPVNEREVDNARRAKQAIERGEEWEECGSCGGWHPATWGGDCRDDEMRLPSHPEDVLGSALPEELEAASKPAAPRLPNYPKDLRPPRPTWRRGPLGPVGSATAARYDSGFGTVDYTCDSCGSKAESKEKPAGWTESGNSHRCPACAAGAGAGVVSVDAAGWITDEIIPLNDDGSRAVPRGLTPEQLAALKADYLTWSGGFEPETPEDVSTYADATMDVNLNRDDAVAALTEWMSIALGDPKWFGSMG